MPDGHKIILSQLLSYVRKDDVSNILDAGSGVTSLSIILSAFPESVIDAIVYPGDHRKIGSIKNSIHEYDQYNLIECDICEKRIDKSYDLVVSHLLLGEAVKFGNSFESLFLRLMAINFEYLVLIDYLEDASVNYEFIDRFFDTQGYRVLRKIIVENSNPQNFTDFTGTHNIGYLVTHK